MHRFLQVKMCGQRRQIVRVMIHVMPHYNVAPVIDIFGAVTGRDLGGVAGDINKIIDATRRQLPRGSRVVVRGQVQTMQASYVGLLSGLVFSIGLVYLLIVVNFQSWLDPFIMISALPAALAGIAWLLFITHTTLSVPALMGAIMCMGVATSNSILVVSFATEKMQAGSDSLSAALAAGFTHLSGTNSKSELGIKLCGVPMSQEPEERKQIAGQTLPSNDVGRQQRPRRRWLSLAIALIAVAALLVSGIWSRVRARTTLKAETAQVALTAVSVVSPKQAAPAQEIILPGNVQPFITAPIYARTNGYLKRWYVDIGARVKQGQLLAVIETPEVDQQLQQARSNLATAKVNLELASVTRTRYLGLLKSNAVSQQDADNAVGAYNANKAIVEADQAAVDQYTALVSFEKIYAPFDGIITARNTDIGDLINSGSGNGVKTDLFHIAQPGKLRVYVNVPEEYSRGVKAGTTADLSLAEFPGSTFRGTLVRTADAITVTTRTLLVEIDVDNPTGTLLTGSYAEVHLAVPAQSSTLLLPVNTLLFRSEGLRVGVVKDGKVTLTAVTPGHDFGNQIEIVAGLKTDDQVIINPPDSLITGQQVKIVQATLPGDIK